MPVSKCREYHSGIRPLAHDALLKQAIEGADLGTEALQDLQTLIRTGGTKATHAGVNVAGQLLELRRQCVGCPTAIAARQWSNRELV
jgi:hypothetical protein